MTLVKCLLLTALLAPAWVVAQTTGTAGLEPHAELLTRGTLSQLRGDYAAAYSAARQLRERFPDHPAGDTFALNTLVTQLAWDDSNTAYDADIRQHAKAAMRACRRLIKRQPNRFEGHYHCGQAQFALTYLSALRGNYYRAGVAGSAAIDYLERALELEPDLIDAKLHLGLCYYYADNLPPYIRAFSRLLWFIPTGNSDKSRPYIHAVTQSGRLYKSVARYLYSDILIKEGNDGPAEALPVLRQLVADYPQNRRFYFRYIALLVELQQQRHALAVIEEFRQDRTCCPRAGSDLTLASVWEAAARYQLGQVDVARKVLAEIQPEQVAQFPSWGKGFYLQLSNALNASTTSG